MERKETTDEVCLVIKAANQKYDDFKINCNLSWKIKDLKHHLSIHYPSKPKTTDQRIIYSGHLLNDDQLINDIIQISNDVSTSNNIYTFHLVCPQQKPCNSSNNNSDNLNNNQKFSNPITNANIVADTFPINQTTNPAPIWNQISGHMGPDNSLMQQSYQAMMNQYYQYMSYYILSSPPIDFASYTAFANAYMQSINPNVITNIQNNLASGNVGNLPQTNTTTTTANLNENLPQNDPQANVVNQNINNVGNNNRAVNADDLMQRDWTDWMYSFSKAIVMLSIIYFYSSLNRLVLFMSIFFIIYFYKNLLNGIHQPNANANAAAANVDEQIRARNNNNNNNNNNNVNAANVQLVEASQQNSDNQNNNDGLVEQEINRYSCVRFLWVFFTSLFTSLIPDPVPIN